MTAPQSTREPSLVNRIVATALEQKLLVVMVTGVILFAGIRSFRRLPVDAYPDLSPTMVEFITQWPGHAAEEVERLITVPVEREMNGLPGLKVVRSVSLYGLSDVTLTFADGTDDYFARQQAFERVGDVDLPD
ncbi:MAG TPA: efflux RND transporter permease subunit, partial [Gemmatimonadales bacterium]|nr:efflux RND transporter permease subunit [Gemmatimonadales bacterium]